MEDDVRNKILMQWTDDDGKENEYLILLRRPKGRKARLLMPRVLQFLGQVSDVSAKIEDEDQSFAAQTKVMDTFFTQANEELFRFILQIDEDPEGQRILEDEMTLIDTIQCVTEAARYMVEESLNRPEVQRALKKSGGDEPENEAEAV